MQPHEVIAKQFELAQNTCRQLQGELQEAMRLLGILVAAGEDALIPISVKMGEHECHDSDCPDALALKKMEQALIPAKNLLLHIRTPQVGVMQGLVEACVSLCKGARSDGLTAPAENVARGLEIAGSPAYAAAYRLARAAIAAYEKLGQPEPVCACDRLECDGFEHWLFGVGSQERDIPEPCPCPVCHQPQAGAVAEGEEELKE